MTKQYFGTVEQQKIDRLKDLEADIMHAMNRSSFNDDTVELRNLLTKTRIKRLKLELEDIK